MGDFFQLSPVTGQALHQPLEEIRDCHTVSAAGVNVITPAKLSFRHIQKALGHALWN